MSFLQKAAFEKRNKELKEWQDKQRDPAVDKMVSQTDWITVKFRLPLVYCETSGLTAGQQLKLWETRCVFVLTTIARYWSVGGLA